MARGGVLGDITAWQMDKLFVNVLHAFEPAGLV